jgi:O-methyltransferase
MKTVKDLVRKLLHRMGFDLRRIPKYINEVKATQIPDYEYYQPLFLPPLFSPWLGYGPFKMYYDIAKHETIVSPERCWILYSLCRQSLSINGDVWECGVYKGGTAAMLAQILHDFSSDTTKHLHLFDTFQGMPESDRSIDLHRKGDFHDATIAEVRTYVNHFNITVYHQGLIPKTFEGLENSVIAFAHIDVDIAQSVKECCHFIFPRLSVGGFMVFDDYGFPFCPGARKAVDDYFSILGVIPLILPTGQAVVFKNK